MRKHHNRLFYSQYSYKTTFEMPWAGILYPTTDENLQKLLDGTHQETIKLNKTFWEFNSTVLKLAKFIIDNRSEMKFRIHQKYSMFYSGKKIADKLCDLFPEYLFNRNYVDPRFGNLGKNVIGCSRLPHGIFQYQIHLKRDAHKYLTNQQRENLFEFIDRNQQNCLCTNKYLLDYLIGKYPHCYHGYFYVRNEKFLTPVYMLAEKAIDKVIKYKKVKNGSDKKVTRK